MNKVVCLLTVLIVLSSVAQAQKNLIKGGIKGDDDIMFYGHKVTGTNILFLVDLSVWRWDDKKPIKTEFKAMLKQIGPTNSPILNFIWFHDGIASKKTGIKLNIPNAIHHLTREIDQLLLFASSRDLERAWTEALRVAQSQKIDVIYFVSAKEGSKKPIALINEWHEKYKKRRLTINTVAIGAESELLEEIAKTGNGEYKCVP